MDLLTGRRFPAHFHPWRDFTVRSTKEQSPKKEREERLLGSPLHQEPEDGSWFVPKAGMGFEGQQAGEVASEPIESNGKSTVLQ